MNKIAVISTNENDDYLFYVPLVCYCWNKLSIGVFVMFNVSKDEKSQAKKNLVENLPQLDYDNTFYDIPKITGMRQEMVTQCSRLYVVDLTHYNCLFITSDSDLIPLSKYWQPDENEFTAYGRDLSDRHYPICFLSANRKKWTELMNLTGNFKADMERDLLPRQDVHSDKFEDYWQVDQNLVAEKLSNFKLTSIERGINSVTGYPTGRIDRSSWKKSLEQPERIDAHLFRKGYEQENWDKIMNLVIECFNPTEYELNWLNNYRNEYLKLL